jgi:hypothetical protein
MRTPRLLAWTAAPLCAASVASAQMHGIPVFSIDWHSPSVSFPNSFTGQPITEGDILAPQLLFPALGPLAVPGIVESGGSNFPSGLGLAGHPGCVGHPGGTPCTVEVDALSFGLDAIAQCNSSGIPISPPWMFSVSFRGLGNPSVGAPPSVNSEGLCGDEAADVFYEMGGLCGPQPILSARPATRGSSTATAWRTARAGSPTRGWA